MADLKFAEFKGSHSEQKRAARAQKSSNVRARKNERSNAQGTAAAGTADGAKTGTSEGQSSKKKRIVQHGNHTHEEEGPATASDAIKMLGLLFAGLAGIVFGIPSMIALLGRFVVGREMFVYGAWVVMIAAAAYMTMVKHKKTTTWDHMFEVLTIWGVVTLGLYTMIDIPKITQGAFAYLNSKLGVAAGLESLDQQGQFQRIHQLVLLLWCTIGFALLLIYLYFDDVDYYKSARKEQKEQDRAKEKEEAALARRAAKKQAKKEEAVKAGRAMDPAKKKMVDLAIYTVFGLGAAYALYRGYYSFLEYQQHLELIHMDNKIG